MWGSFLKASSLDVSDHEVGPVGVVEFDPTIVYGRRAPRIAQIRDEGLGGGRGFLGREAAQGAKKLGDRDPEWDEHHPESAVAGPRFLLPVRPDLPVQPTRPHGFPDLIDLGRRRAAVELDHQISHESPRCLRFVCRWTPSGRRDPASSALSLVS
jgi:hypothetical protein